MPDSRPKGDQRGHKGASSAKEGLLIGESVRSTRNSPRDSPRDNIGPKGDQRRYKGASSAKEGFLIGKPVKSIRDSPRDCYRDDIGYSNRAKVYSLELINSITTNKEQNRSSIGTRLGGIEEDKVIELPKLYILQ